MKFNCLVIILFLSLSGFSTAHAQTTDKLIDTVIQKMYWYGLQKPTSLLYVHFDKNIYTSKEYVWFTGYLLSASVKDDPTALSVALVRNDDRSILAERKFVMNAGLSFGDMFIPDSLPAGDYSFVCYTNHIVNGNPTDVFIQPLTVKDAYQPRFIASLNLLDSLTADLDSARVLVKAYTTDIKLLKDASVKYFIGDRRNPVKQGTINTNSFGEATISIPLKSLTSANNILQTEINSGKEMQAFNIKLPLYKKEALVKFYPEGGNLVEGKENTVGWEATNNEGDPLQLKGILYQGDKPLFALTTNYYGMGRFSINPQNGSRYYVRVKANEQSKDSATFNLPAMISNAPVAGIATALASDMLHVQLNTGPAGNRWRLMIHNFRRAFYSAIVLSTGRQLTINVPLKDIPRGLYTLTLFDSLLRPHVERLFFAHFDSRNRVEIKTNATSYGLRKKVELDFKITDARSKPVTGMVSVSCAQENRYDAKKMTDIESYANLQHELSSLPFRSKWMAGENDNKEYLENLLLVRGWRRYTWRDVIAVNAHDTVQKLTPLIYRGRAISQGRAGKELPQIHLLKATTYSILKADSLLNFEIPTPRLILKPDQYPRVFVKHERQDKQEKYAIHVFDPYKELNKLLAAKVELNSYTTNSFEKKSQVVSLADSTRGKRLLDVVVSSNKDGNFAANICGDYVCVANVLNCPNHRFGGSEPIVGVRYHTGKGSLVYQGCVGMKYLSMLDGIYTKKEFYVTDYSNIDVSQSDNFSTMYWNHSILTNNRGEGSVKFFTNDLPGKFRITIQGFTNNNVVYGEHTITVNKDN